MLDDEDGARRRIPFLGRDKIVVTNPGTSVRLGPDGSMKRKRLDPDLGGGLSAVAPDAPAPVPPAGAPPQGNAGDRPPPDEQTVVHKPTARKHHLEPRLLHEGTVGRAQLDPKQNIIERIRTSPATAETETEADQQR